MSVKKQIEIRSLIYDLNEETRTAVVVGCPDYGNNTPFTIAILIPNTITFDGQNYTVTEIGYEAFYNCDSLESIVLPDSVTSIEEFAFQWCANLKSITLPDGITEIGGGAFYGCTSLKKITIPDGLTEIGWNAFEGCTSLESVMIPDSVTSIGDNAFLDCENLSEIIIPDTEKAFPLWVSLMESGYADLVRQV